MLYLSTAAKVSPPPAIEKAALSAIAFEITSVPLAKASISKTPTGPFHKIVPADFIISATFAAVSGP